MTDEFKVQAYNLRKEGKSWREIATALDCTRSAAKYAATHVAIAIPVELIYKGDKYPELKGKRVTVRTLVAVLQVGNQVALDLMCRYRKDVTAILDEEDLDTKQDLWARELAVMTPIMIELNNNKFIDYTKEEVNGSESKAVPNRGVHGT